MKVVISWNFPGGTGKTHVTLQNSRFPGADSNWTPHESKPEELPFDPTCQVKLGTEMNYKHA
jgi:hypothetical protein